MFHWLLMDVSESVLSTKTHSIHTNRRKQRAPNHTSLRSPLTSRVNLCHDLWTLTLWPCFSQPIRTALNGAYIHVRLWETSWDKRRAALMSIAHFSHMKTTDTCSYLYSPQTPKFVNRRVFNLVGVHFEFDERAVKLHSARLPHRSGALNQQSSTHLHINTWLFLKKSRHIHMCRSRRRAIQVKAD